MKFSGVTILQGVEFPIFLFIFAWALQQQRYCAVCGDWRRVYNAVSACVLLVNSVVDNGDQSREWVTQSDP